MRNHSVIRERADKICFPGKMLRCFRSPYRCSGKLYFVLCAGIFLFMLVLNFLTPKCVDDYSYMFSLVDNSRIASLSGIFSSLYAHAFSMNGRLAAHFFVYLFDMLPKAVFNIVNAGMFLLMLLLCMRFCFRRGNCLRSRDRFRRGNCFLLLLLFCCVWVFEYDFGQVNLWLTGSCNYLWAVVFSLLYILPFFRLYTGGGAVFCGGASCGDAFSRSTGKSSGAEKGYSVRTGCSAEKRCGTEKGSVTGKGCGGEKNCHAGNDHGREKRCGGWKVLFLLFSFLCGAYNEVASSSMVFIACLFLFLTICCGRRPSTFYFVSVAAAVLGFLTMFLAPAQSAKSGLALPFGERLLSALDMYAAFLPLLLVWLVLFVLLFLFREKAGCQEMVGGSGKDDDSVKISCSGKTGDASDPDSTVNTVTDSGRSTALCKLLASAPLTVSAVFLLGSLCANFVLVFAGSYAGRCAAPALIYLLIALAVLLPGTAAFTAPVRKHQYLSLLPALLLLILLLFTVYRGIFGVYDIYRTGRDMRSNISVLETCRDNGEKTAEIRYVYPATKYSAIYNLKYIDTETPDTWPNESMAAFYGLDKVTGLP